MALFRMKPWYKIKRKKISKYNVTIPNEIGANGRGIAFSDYALFAYSNKVTVYDNSFTAIHAPDLHDTQLFPAIATIENHVLIGGGGTANTGASLVYTGYASNLISVYDSSLTKLNNITMPSSRKDMAAASVDDYAIFTGGGVMANMQDCYADAYAINKSLTLSNAPSLPERKTLHAGVSFKNYALFGGGQSFTSVSYAYKSSSYSSSVCYYNNSLTISNCTNLSRSRHSLVATATDDYAMFGGGMKYNYNYGDYWLPSDDVDAYNSSLTRILPTVKFLYPVTYLAATSIDEFCIFGGGASGVNMDTYRITCNIYNKDLTKIELNLNKGVKNLSAASVADYVIFAGGTTPDTSTNKQTVFKVA